MQKGKEDDLNYKLYQTIVRKYFFEKSYKKELEEISAKISEYYRKKEAKKERIATLQKDTLQIKE